MFFPFRKSYTAKSKVGKHIKFKVICHHKRILYCPELFHHPKMSHQLHIFNSFFPPQMPGNHCSAYHPYSSPFSRMTYKWNYTIYNLFRLFHLAICNEDSSIYLHDLFNICLWVLSVFLLSDTSQAHLIFLLQALKLFLFSGSWV